MGYGRHSEVINGLEQVFCTHCKKYKSVGEFNLRTPLLKLYQYYCKPCQADLDKANYLKRQEKRGGKRFVSRSDNPELSCCAHCKQWKSKNQFNFWNVKKGILQYYCRDCQHEVDRQHYLSNPRRILDRNKAAMNKYRDEAREYVYQYLLTNPCVDCGEADPLVLTFDHHNGDKVANVASMVGEGRTLKAVIAEIEKCEVVCHNCHARRTQKRQGAFRWKRSNGG